MPRTFELKFASSRGDFVLLVEKVAVLSKALVPFTYLLSTESSITTTDQAAVQELSETLLTSPLTHAGETSRTLLVQANDSRWLVFGRREADASGKLMLRVRARLVGGTALKGIQETEVEAEESRFLTKTVRRALDEHVSKNKKRKRTVVEDALPITSPDTTLEPGKAAETVESTGGKSVISKESSDAATSTSKAPNAASTLKVSSSASILKPSKVPKTVSAEPVKSTDDASLAPDLRSVKDKIKKMTMNLLSIRGITKTSKDFKELYQHTLQATSFALRNVDHTDSETWQRKAMSVTDQLIDLFVRHQLPLTAGAAAAVTSR